MKIIQRIEIGKSQSNNGTPECQGQQEPPELLTQQQFAKLVPVIVGYSDEPDAKTIGNDTPDAVELGNGEDGERHEEKQPEEVVAA